MKKTAAAFAVVLLALTASAEDTRGGEPPQEITSKFYGAGVQRSLVDRGSAGGNVLVLSVPSADKFHEATVESSAVDEGVLFKLKANSAASTATASHLEPANASNSFRTEKLNGFDFVSEALPPFEVIAVDEKRTMSATGAEIVVSGGKAHGLEKGDTLVIYEERARLGKNRTILACVAYARVTKSGEALSDAVIYKSFSSVSKGFMAEKGSEVAFIRPQGYRSVSSDIEGEIIYLSENHELSAAGYTAISNIGRSHSVKEGDKFEVIRTLTEHGVTKDSVIGEAQLILFGGNFSTIYFVITEKEVKKGDKLRLHKIAVF